MYVDDCSDSSIGSGLLSVSAIRPSAKIVRDGEQLMVEKRTALRSNVIRSAEAGHPMYVA